MALRLNPPTEKTFILNEVDEEYNIKEGEGTTVTIRQATQAQHEARTDLFSEMTSRMGGDTGIFEIVQRYSFLEVERKEVYLTLMASNIEDADGSALFKSSMDAKGRQYLNMTEIQFKEAWGKLPILVTEAIHKRVIEVNVDWSRVAGEAG